MKSCFFLGDQLVPAEIIPALEAMVERHITQYGVEEFVVGNYGGFNYLAAKVLTSARVRHPDIVLTLLCPHRCPERPILPFCQFDGISFLPVTDTVPPDSSAVSASRYALRCTDYLIAYIQDPTAGINELLNEVFSGERQIKVSFL